MRVCWLARPAVGGGGLADGELAIRNEWMCSWYCPLQSVSSKPRYRHRLSSVVGDLDELRSGSGSALHDHADGGPMPGALVMSMQRDVGVPSQCPDTHAGVLGDPSARLRRLGRRTP